MSEEIVAGDFKHGGYYGYTLKGCKCRKCKAWWAARWARYKRDRIARTGEAYNSRLGGFVPGKPCACGCGTRIPAERPENYKRGHAPKGTAA